MKIDKHREKVIFRAEEGEELEISYDNRGEPFREGLSISLDGNESHVSLFIEKREARLLRDLLNNLYPVKS